MNERAWASDANDAARHLAVIFGDVFVGASWAFGDVVEMVGPAMAVPTLGSPSMVGPSMADPSMETA